MKEKKKLGVIGGMGPMATAYFAELVTEMTDAACDCEHIEMDLRSIPSIPDRTAFILKKSTDNPLPYILKAGEKLIQDGAQVLAIPCNTAFYFYPEFIWQFSVPVINPVTETVKYLKHRNINRVGIMATDGTIQTGLFQKELLYNGMVPVLPDVEEQKLVMKLIYEDVKAGKNLDEESFYQVSQSMFADGAEIIVLGCTELSMMKRCRIMKPGYLDTLDILAQRTVEECATLKEEYRELITV